MKSVEIFIDDLIPEKRQEVIDTFGEETNWDVFPMATVTVED